MGLLSPPHPSIPNVILRYSVTLSLRFPLSPAFVFLPLEEIVISGK